MLSHTESIARQLFRHYFPKLRVQYGIRPNWLKWPVTGNNLELDLYWPDIHASAEINGIQHGRPVLGMQKDFAAFERQQRRDAWKTNECKNLGIALYPLTIFDLTESRFEPFIKVFAATHGLQLNRYVGRPEHLYAQAEALTHAKAPYIKTPRRKPGLGNVLRRTFHMGGYR